MEPASHARIDPVTVEGLEDVFVSPEAPVQESVSPKPARPFRSAAHLLESLRQEHGGSLPGSPAQSISPVPQDNLVVAESISPVPHNSSLDVQKSESEQSAERARATAQAIARCLDVRSEAVIEHHKITKPKGKNSKKNKTVEEWRIKWTSTESGKASAEPGKASAELANIDQSGSGLFDHVSELLRQNATLIAKLEAATYRIGYLEAELENLRSQAGFSDCDAQVAELPLAKPVIHAISERREKRVNNKSSATSAGDFWDEPVWTGSNVPSQKIVQEPLPVEAITNSPDDTFDSGLFTWLPPRA